MTNKYRTDVPDGEFHHRMSRTIAGRAFSFEWWGGEYIQVCKNLQFAHPGEVINVWDCATDGPRYPRTILGMTQAVSNWLDNYGADNLVSDSQNWS